MKRFIAGRRGLLALALAATLAAALHAHDSERTHETGSRGRAATGTKPAVRVTNPAGAEPMPIALEIDRLAKLAQARRASPATDDPFMVNAPKPQLQAPPVVVAAPAPAPPQAPPAPFRFIGAQHDAGTQVVFLEHQNRTHIVRIGENIGGDWRLDRLTERSVILTYVPLGQQRAIMIGGAS